MNAEIYFPREGKAFGQTAEKSFDATVKKLNESDLNIIYKTEIDLSEKSIADALRVTDSGDEKIGVILIADALAEDNSKKAAEFFESIGVLGKMNRICAKCIDLSEEDEQNQGSGTDGKKKKSRKEKKNRKKLSDTAPIDISEGILTIEKRDIYAYTAEYNNKLVVLLPRHELLDTTFNSVLYTISRTLISPKKKTSFYKRFIPCSGDRPLDVVRKIVLMLAICVFLVSSYMLVNILIIQPSVNDNLNNDLKSLLVSTPDEEPDENGVVKTKKLPTDGSEGTISDFSGLLAENPDTVGWIKIPDTRIDLVVVKPKDGVDPEYYLHRDFYGNYSGYGTVFMDYRSTMDSKNLILHGHHMQDGRMFADLGEYASLKFYKNHPVFTFNTIYEKARWKVISVFKTNTLEYQGEFFNYLRGDFNSDYDYLNFIYQLRVRSIIDCPVDFNENDTIVTLSTCTYDFEDFRFVVVARKVRDGESTEVDISKAKENPNPLYPDVWYNNYGGTRPEVTTFQDALNNKKIDWYIGSENFSDKDDKKLQKLLIEGKANALKLLKKTAEENEYGDVEKAQIDKLIEKYTTSINAAKDATEVNRLYDEASKLIKEVKTKKQLESEAQESRKVAEESRKKAASEAANELKSYKETAVTEMKNSIAGNAYRQAQASVVKDLISSYTTLINNAANKADVDKHKKDGISALKKVKTDAEMTAQERADEASRRAQQSSREESRTPQTSVDPPSESPSESSIESSDNEAEILAKAKADAIVDINEYVNADDYPDTAKNRINELITYYSAMINGCSSTADVSYYLTSAQNKIDEVVASAYDTSDETGA